MAVSCGAGSTRVSGNHIGCSENRQHLSANMGTRSIVLEREHVLLDHMTLSTPELEHLTASIREICVECG